MIQGDELDLRLNSASINENGRFTIIEQTNALPDEKINFNVFTTIISKQTLTHKFYSQIMNGNTKLIIFSAKLPNYIKELFEKGFNLKNLAIVGLRSWNKDEWTFIQNNKIRHFTMKEITMEGLQEVCDSAMAFARNSESFFLSINLDVLDPAFTNMEQEPGGLTTRELIYMTQRFSLLQNLKATDITGLTNNNPVTKIVEKLVTELG